MAGISLGVWGVEWMVILIVAAAMALWIWKMQFDYQLVMAGVMLVLMGFVYGSWSNGEIMGRECSYRAATSWMMIENPNIKEDRQQFIGEGGDCAVYVTAARYYELNRGDEIILRGGKYQNLDEVAEYSSGFADYLRKKGVIGTVRWPEVEIINDKRSRLAEWRRGLADRVEKLWPEPDASIIQAMVMAEKGTIPDGITRQFRAAGVSHVLAISGLHISLLVGVLAGLLYLLPVTPWPRTVFLLVLLWLYVLFIGVQASALRAATFWTIYILALRFKMLVSLPTVVMLTVSILMTIRPELAGQVGWQLSISAVAGIFGALFVTGRIGHELNGFGQWLKSLIVVSLGAALATAPLAAYHFGNVSLIGVAANILVVPVVPMVLILSIISLVLSVFMMPLALMMAWTVHVFMGWMILVTGWLTIIPGVYFEEVKFPLWGVGVYYGGLILGMMAIVKWQKRNWREIWG